MDTLSKNKSLIAIIVIFVAALAIYNVFKPELTIDPAPAADIGSDLVSLHERIQAVTLDQTLFASALYRSLSDFSVEIEPEPTGRVNPFAAIGQD